MAGAAVLHSSVTSKSIQSNSMCLLFFWTISLVLQLSQHGRGTEALTGPERNELAPVKSDQSVIQISFEDGRDTDKMNFESVVPNVINQDYALQKRDPLSAIRGIYGGAYMVLNNLGNLETFVRHTWHVILGTCSKDGTKLKNGGCLSADGRFITFKGEILEFVHESIHVFAISPIGHPQFIVVTGRRVFLNDELIVQNIDVTDELPATPTYQKCADNSYWYTNLPVGEPMTSEEIQEFRMLPSLIEQERDKAVRGVLAAAARKVARAANRADNQSKNAPSQEKNRLGRTSPPSDERSRGRPTVSDESDLRTVQLDDGNESGYDLILSRLREESAFHGPSTAFRRAVTATRPASSSACGTASERISRGAKALRPSTARARLGNVFRMFKSLYSSRNEQESINRGVPRLRTPNNRPTSGLGSQTRAKSPRK